MRKTPPAKAPAMDLTSGVPDDDDEPTVQIPAEIAEIDKLLPGFEMADEPIPVPEDATMIPGDIVSTDIHDYAADQPTYDPKSFSDTTNARARGHEIPSGSTPLSGQIIPPRPHPTAGSVVYESRIRILEAWQYPGRVPKDAPDYVDRNWVGWADPDPIRGREGSPCLRVPVAGDPYAVVICRPGDFVVRQEVQMAPGYPSAEKTEVWEEEQFSRLFIASNPDMDEAAAASAA